MLMVSMINRVIFIIDEKENLENLNDTYKEYIKLKRQDLADASKKSAQFTVNDYKGETQRIESLKQYLEYAKKEIAGTLQTSDLEQVNFLQNYLGVSFDKSEIEKALSTSKTEIANSIIDMQADVRNQVMNSEEWNKLGDDTQNAILKAFSEVSNQYVSEFSEKITTGEMSVKSFLHTMENTQAFKDYIQNIKDSGNVTEEFEGKIATLESKLESLSDTRSKIEQLQNILQNFDLGNLSAEDMEQLLSISEEFLPYLNDEIALREKLTQTIDDSKNAYKSTYEYMILLSSSTYGELSNKIENYFNGLGIAYEDDLKKLQI